MTVCYRTAKLVIKAERVGIVKNVGCQVIKLKWRSLKVRNLSRELLMLQYLIFSVYLKKKKSSPWTIGFFEAEGFAVGVSTVMIKQITPV